MPTLHFISHTHWDREWHQPFQIFRIWLAQTIDKTLDILASDPDYRYFMLDGQTIVLEDYMEIEPAREAELRKHIESGRVLVGPWYVLPDEFLVSGEAIIRNLQRGMRIANEWGRSMLVGYIPDPFGHISQMPQLLKGFGIDVAMFRRGLADEPTELLWEGADGTRVFTTYLRDGYDNAAWLPQDPQGFVNTLRKLVESLTPYATTKHMLMMHGTDHMQPWAGLPALLHLAQKELEDTRVLHSTLPEYAAAVDRALSAEAKAQLPVAHGELRNPKRHHLLPGVVSTRMWIKQRNMRAQDLLERWAEPLAAVAMGLAGENGGVEILELRPELELAWKYLLQNHPHDSICGCSVDQVHFEMGPRFDAVDQIGGAVVAGAEKVILTAIDTTRDGINKGLGIVVFNSTPAQSSQAVTVGVDLPRGMDAFQIVDATGRILPVVELGSQVVEYARVTTTPEQLRWVFGAAQSGSVEGHELRDFEWKIDGEGVYVDLTVSDQGAQDMALVRRKLEQLSELLANPALKLYHLVIHSLKQVELIFEAPDLPGNGYKTFWLVPAENAVPTRTVDSELSIENEFLHVRANPMDGTLTITDKSTGTVFAGANRFVDGGDRGDLYNFCAPEQDTVVSAPTQPPHIKRRVDGAVRQELSIESVLQVPARLGPNRATRSAESAEIPITTVASLAAGARHVEFFTRVENTARDHRLRVEFPTPIQTAVSLADQAFDLVKRSIQLQTETAGWVEQPVPTLPLQKFMLVEDGGEGAALATRGLMEYEVRSENGSNNSAGVTIALTLLRCIEWLSRPDLSNRSGDAGPEKLTPGAQELRMHEFNYAFIPYATGDTGGKVLTRREARSIAFGFAVPAQAVATDMHQGVLPFESGWVSVSHPDFIVTAIKPAESGAGLIVRGYNAGESTIAVRLKPFRPFARALRVNLNESPVGELSWNNAREIELAVGPREIVTVWFQNR